MIYLHLGLLILAIAITAISLEFLIEKAAGWSSSIKKPERPLNVFFDRVFPIPEDPGWIFVTPSYFYFKLPTGDIHVQYHALGNVTANLNIGCYNMDVPIADYNRFKKYAAAIAKAVNNRHEWNLHANKQALLEKLPKAL